MPTVGRVLSYASGLALPAELTAAEIAFFNRAETRCWWAAPHGMRLFGLAETWECRKSAIKVAPIVSGQRPLLVTSGGLNSQPLLRGLTADPSGGLVSASGQDVVPLTGDWTIFAVSKNGTSSTSHLASIVGNAGSNIFVRQRSSNLIQVYTGTIASQTLALQGTCSGSAPHLVAVAYKRSTSALTLHVDGTQVGSATVSLPQATTRLALMTGYDLSAGQATGQGREVDLYTLGVATTNMPDNAAWKAALHAYVAAVFPALTLS